MKFKDLPHSRIMLMSLMEAVTKATDEAVRRAYRNGFDVGYLQAEVEHLEATRQVYVDGFNSGFSDGWDAAEMSQ